VEVIAEVDRAPLDFPSVPTDDVSLAIARHVLPWLTPGCSVQYGPGPIADAVLDLVEHPLRLRSGMLTDGALRLAERGLLAGTPSAAYVAGTGPLYEWSAGRGIVDRVENTHALPSAEDSPMVTVNMALEIDVYGQVNVQSADGREIGGIGGHPDFAVVGAVSPGGISIVALPTRRGNRSTLRKQLTGPVSTPRFDVDVVVTEHGSVDLRGLCDAERAVAVSSLWPESPPLDIN
jgi:acyl-CoA hydrolase